jgi:hypothetical protein
MRDGFWCFVVICVLSSSAWSADRKVVLTSAATADASANPVEVREFDVYVDNRNLGTHRLAIRTEGQNHKVDIQTDVKVDVVIYAYVFKLRASENWRDGRLEQSEIRCEDGGKKRSCTLKVEGSKHQIEFNGKPGTPRAQRFAMTTAYWRLPSAELREKAFPIVDIDTGTPREATITLVGPDIVKAGKESVACAHYKIDGPSPAELWFDNQSRLVWQKSIEQGHHTELKLKQIRLSKDGN